MKTEYPFTEQTAPAMKMWEGRKQHLEEDLRFLRRLVTGERTPAWSVDAAERLEEYRIGAETFLMDLERVDNETELEILEPKLGAWKEDLYAYLLPASAPDEE